METPEPLADRVARAGPGAVPVAAALPEVRAEQAQPATRATVMAAEEAGAVEPRRMPLPAIRAGRAQPERRAARALRARARIRAMQATQGPQVVRARPETHLLSGLSLTSPVEPLGRLETEALQETLGTRATMAPVVQLETVDPLETPAMLETLEIEAGRGALVAVVADLQTVAPAILVMREAMRRALETLGRMVTAVAVAPEASRSLLTALPETLEPMEQPERPEARELARLAAMLVERETRARTATRAPGAGLAVREERQTLRTTIITTTPFRGIRRMP